MLSRITEISKKNRIRLAVAAGLLLVWVFLTVDDWGRDLVSHEAAITDDAEELELRPLTTTRTSLEMADAVKMAASRIRNWSYVGDASEGNNRLLYFVRTNRLLRLKDDVTIRIEDIGPRRRITGESIGRLGIGDLGRNPRNLQRLLDELRLVLQGSGYIRHARAGGEEEP